MAVVEDRGRVLGRVAGGNGESAAARVVGAARAFHPLPAVVLAAGAGGGLEVDLLARALPHVGDVEIARLPVEREAPRIAQPQGPDLVAHRRVADERIRRRHAVEGRSPGVHVDVEAQDLA